MVGLAREMDLLSMILFENILSQYRRHFPALKTFRDCIYYLRVGHELDRKFPVIVIFLLSNDIFFIEIVYASDVI